MDVVMHFECCIFNDSFRANTTTGNEGITCVPVTSNTVEIPLANACTDINFIHKCAPLYISVEAIITEDSSQNAKCTGKNI